MDFHGFSYLTYVTYVTYLTYVTYVTYVTYLCHLYPPYYMSATEALHFHSEYFRRNPSILFFDEYVRTHTRRLLLIMSLM